MPPADLHQRTLTLHTIPAGTTLYRIFWTHHDPVFFDKSGDGRWNAPAAEYGVCYAGEESHIAFAETFLRQADIPYVTADQLRPRGIARLIPTRPLILASLHGPGLSRHGATAAVVQGDYTTCQAWSLALHNHPRQPDGIRYRARHDDDGFSMAIFDRASGTLREQSRAGLASPAMRAELGGWLNRYGKGLIGRFE